MARRSGFMLCVLVCCLLILAGCEYSRQDGVRYVRDYYRHHKDEIFEAIPSLEALCPEYTSISVREDHHNRLMMRYRYNYWWYFSVEDAKILRLFEGKTQLRHIRLYPNGIVQFSFSGFDDDYGALYIGFYYSKDDTPLVVGPPGYNLSLTGKCYLKEDGNGWSAAFQHLTDEEASSVREYEMYTERIDDRIFFCEYVLP